MQWLDEPHDEPPRLAGAAEQLTAWREDTLADERRAAIERPADPTARFSGWWWSAPLPSRLVTTTRSVPELGLGALGLAGVPQFVGEFGGLAGRLCR